MAATEAVVGWGVLLAVSSVTAAVIVNGAVGNYQDSKGQGYGAVSNTAAVSTASIAAAMVQPKQATPDPTADAATHGTAVVKTFTITNDSNITDAYVLSALTASAGTIQTIAFTTPGGTPIPATIGSTVSPPVPPGGSITVAVTVATTGAAVGSNIELTLTAKTTAHSQNGPQTDIGKLWVYVARGPQITGIAPSINGVPEKPPAAGFAIVELINGLSVAQAEPGSAVNLSVPFTNSGDAPALGLTVSAQIPPQLAAVAGSVKLQTIDHRTGKSVTLAADPRTVINGSTVSATLPQLDPGIDVTLTYAATALPTVPIGTVVPNTATIAAQSMTNVVSEPAMLFVGAMNVVYDALGGVAHPIAGAVVTLLDFSGGQKAKLAATGSVPNPGDADPFTTASNGAFGFTLGTPSASGTEYELDAAAPGYLNRKIKVGVAAGKDGLPAITLSALDGQPLATAGGFSLTGAPVSVAGIAGFFDNVPLFSPQMLSLTLTADRTVASAGDRLAYTIDFGPGSKPLSDPGELSVQLPPSIAYANGTTRLGGAAAEPVVSAKTLTWTFKELTARRTLTFDAVLLPGVTAGATLSTRAHLSVMLAGTPLGVDASASVAIVGGPLGARSILSGRVFTDHARDGRFAAGDAGVAGVRIFLEDGESALTDHDGRFSFPAARPGMHVLHLDPITLPAGLHTYHGFPVNDPRSGERLVHGIFDSGLMSDVNFAVSDAAGH